MTLQIVLSALLALIATALVVVPLLRGRDRSARRADYDLQVYRDQLGEIDRDVERGLLTETQASAARVEIQRRMLTIDAEERRSTKTPGAAPGHGPRVVLAVGMAVLVPVAALGVYGSIGAPGLPDSPYAAREQERLGMTAAEVARLREVVTALENQVADTPDNQPAWLLLAENYATLQKWPQAVGAYNRAVRLGGVSGDTWAALGEAHFFANDGQVVPAAQAAFRNTLRANRTEPRARYYLGLGYLQDDQPRKALAVWRQLSATSPPDAPWMSMLRNRMAAAGEQHGIAPVTVAAMHPLDLYDAEQRGEDVGLEASPGEDAAAQAASNADAARSGGGLSAEEQAMVEGMVATLAQRLEETPDDFEGWVRLGRSYAVMGRFAQAADAYGRAVSLRPDDIEVRFSHASTLLADARSREEEPPAAFFAAMNDILSLDADNPDALYFAGMGAAQGGNPEEARRLWTLLLDILPPDSPERSDIEAQIQALPPQG